VRCFNYFAPAIQALAAIAIVGLTAVIVYLTSRYVAVSEALQKPKVMVRLEPRDWNDAVLLAPNVAQVSQLPVVTLINVGTGPALNLLYSFRHADAPPGGPTTSDSGFVPYLKMGGEWGTQLSRNLLPNRIFEYSAEYESLSGKRYLTRFKIENSILVKQ
jgi:hypothetical protein